MAGVRKLKTGSRPEDILSAKSEMVPVGAIDVSSAFDPVFSNCSFDIFVKRYDAPALKIGISVEQRKSSFFPGEVY